MAETAGLALGGIALVGLVTTCVEISEYLESAKNRAEDFTMALTKVNLIKKRLRDWGAALPDDMTPDPRSNHTIAPDQCGVLIEETLLRIRILLDKTNRMSRKHCLRSPTHQCDLNAHSGFWLPSEKLPCRSRSVVSVISLPSDSGASFKTTHPRRPQFLLSFSLKVLWVFLDKKKFDSIIEQLDFLLSNLEKISETPQGRREMPQNNGSRQGPASSGRNHTETQEKNDHKFTHELEIQSLDGEEAECTPGSEYLVGEVYEPSEGSLQWLNSSQNQSGPVTLYNAIKIKQPSGSAELPHHPHTNGKSQEGDEAPADTGEHLFQNNIANDDSAQLQGDFGVTKGRSHKFIGNSSNKTALQGQGSFNSQAVKELLEYKASRRNKRDADGKTDGAN